MTATTDRAPAVPRNRFAVYRRRLTLTGAVGPAVVLVVLFLVYVAVQPNVLSVLKINTIADESATVAIAAAGETLVVLAGGFDLSVGSVLSLVNVLIATQIRDSPGSQLLMIVVALAVGAAVGALNGVLVTLLRIPSIVATLATSFLWGGVALLVLSQPGGTVPDQFVAWFTDNAFDVFPNALILLIVVILLWLYLKRTRLGRAIYAVGGDPTAATANGIRVRETSLAAYTLAGVLYGLAGAFLTAQSSSGDPNVGGPLLLSVFAAVVIGGTAFGGGKGDLVGSIIGAFILYLIADVLFAIGVSSFYTNILNGAVLLVAVLAGSLVGLGKLLAPRRQRRAASTPDPGQKAVQGGH
jgi:ribose transport system permease protein